MKVNAVPFFRHSFTQRDLKEVSDTIKSGWLTTGKKTIRFEQNIAEYTGAPYTVALSSCTAALHLLLRAVGIGPGDEVITTPYTFASTSEAILYNGARPVYCDVNYDTLNIDPEEAAKKITIKTKALLPVHIAGLPLDMSGFLKLARDHKIKLFDDAAHALGAEFKGCKIGSLGDGSTFSFYAIKNLSTGEGGMVATRHKKLADKVRLLSLHAMSKGAWNRYDKGGSWRYDLLDLGFKYNMSDLHASLGLSQFERFEKFQEKRRRAAERYLKNLSHLDAIKLPAQCENGRHAWHIFIIRPRPRMLNITRDEFIVKLGENRIGTSVHFIPLFLQKYYRNALKLSSRDYPRAARAFREVITIPLYPSIKPAEIDYVCEVIEKICRRHKR